MPRMTRVALKNLNTVSQIEESLLKPSRGERFVEVLVSAVGSVPCVAAHAAFFAGWVAINLGWLNAPVFDPYPFSLLGVVVSAEAIFLALCVLMNQKRQNQHGQLWEHLNLQINLLSEQEMTKVLQLLNEISDHVGLRRPKPGAEMKEMIQETPVEILAEEVGKRKEQKPPT
jgi:uncharacterized membrane protein